MRRSRRSSSIAAVAVATALLAGCNKPLDDEQCKKVVDKMVDLLAASEPASDRVEKVKAEVKADRRSVQNVKDTCVGKMTRAQLDCVMAARSFQDAMGCDGK